MRVRLVLLYCLSAIALFSAVPGKATAQAVQSDPLTNDERSTVRVIALYFDQLGQLTGADGGSGFVIGPGKVITNAHVISANGTQATAVFVIPDRRSGADGMRAQIIDASQDYDLALLEADQLAAPPLTLSDAMPTKEATVRALGYPGVTDRVRNLQASEILSPSEPYVTAGSIALLSDRAPGGIRVPTIFHTAAVNPGNSGGPLTDECGRVIGVNTWSVGGTVGSEGETIPAGQFIATRSANLIEFLNRENVSALVDNQPCVTPTAVDPVIEARLEADEKALADARATTDAQAKLAAQTQARDQLILWALATVFAIGLLGLIAFVVVRARSGGEPSKSGSAPDAVVQTGSPSRQLASPVILALSAMVAIALSGLGAWIALQHTSSSSAAPGPTPAAASKVSLTCVDEAGGGTLSLTFDESGACVNDRTQYQKVGSEYRRVIVHGREEKASLMRLAGDYSQLSRATYDLDPASYRRLVSLRNSLPLAGCSNDASTISALDALNRAAAPYFHSAQVQMTVWSCRPSSVQVSIGHTSDGK